ncbi:unnamed protein product, partial [Effrenium voratum]
DNRYCTGKSSACKMCCSVDELAMVHKGSSNAVHNNAERIVVPGAGGEVQVFHVMQGRIPTELLAALSAPLSDEDCTALYHEVGLHRALPVPKTERPKVLWLFGPPAAGKSTLAAEHSPTIFGINGSAVSVDGEEFLGQRKTLFFFIAIACTTLTCLHAP